MPHILAIVSPKGGVGKTTTAIHLSAALASLGRSVLLVDLAPLGNATSGLGLSRDALERGTAEVLFGFSEPGPAIQRTPVPGLDLMPATRALVGLEVELSQYVNRELRLRGALLRGARAYDHVILDCPPGQGLLTVNALCAAAGVLVPLAGEYFAMEGLCDALRMVSAARQGLNRHLQRVGLLLTMVEPRSRLGAEVAAQARAVFGDEVFRVEIPRDIAVAESASFGLPAGMHDPSSPAALAHLSLASELLARVAPPLWAELAQEAS